MTIPKSMTINLHLHAYCSILFGQVDTWACFACTYVNPLDARFCCICEGPRVPGAGGEESGSSNEGMVDDMEPMQDPAALGSDDDGGPDALEEWVCMACTFLNSPYTRQCEICQAQK